jgi:hypothetical protein
LSEILGFLSAKVEKEETKTASSGKERIMSLIQEAADYALL